MMDCNHDIDKTLEDFHPLIKKSLFNTKPQNRQDLEQELLLKVTETVYFKHFDAPGFWDFLNTFK